MRLARAARELRAATTAFRVQAEPALAELRTAVRAAGFEVDRIDAIVTTAAAMTDRVDAASRVARNTIGSPVVKVIAVGTGTRRAWSRLRSRRSSQL
jgi:hypothetical protein